MGVAVVEVVVLMLLEALDFSQRQPVVATETRAEIGPPLAMTVVVVVREAREASPLVVLVARLTSSPLLEPMPRLQRVVMETPRPPLISFLLLWPTQAMVDGVEVIVASASATVRQALSAFVTNSNNGPLFKIRGV
jgi:hypothetical protein